MWGVGLGFLWLISDVSMRASCWGFFLSVSFAPTVQRSLNFIRYFKHVVFLDANFSRVNLCDLFSSFQVDWENNATQKNISL